MVKKGLLISAFVLICLASSAQRVGSSPEYIKALTAEWKGERFLMEGRKFQTLFSKD
jgi:hypothetical protein